MLELDHQLGARIKAARLQAGITQTILSVRAGISIGTLQRAENYGSVSPRTIGALARALNIPIDDLRGRVRGTSSEHASRPGEPTRRGRA